MKNTAKKRRPMAFRSIATRIICLTVALWLLAMVFLTWAVAGDMYHQVNALAKQVGSNSRYFIEAAIPDSSEGVFMVHSATNLYSFSYLKPLLPIVADHMVRNYATQNRFWNRFDILFGYEAALVHRDTEGNIVVGNGNYLTISYTTDNRWYAGNIDSMGECYITLDELEGGLDAFSQYKSTSGMFASRYLYRIEGWFERDRFHPVLVEECIRPYDASMDAGAESSRRVYNNLDIRMDFLKWTTILEGNNPENRETDTIFAWNLAVTSPIENAFNANGKTYSSLTELAAAPDDERYDCIKYNLNESIIICTTSSENGSTIVAFRCWPLKYALLRMIPTYLISLSLIGLVLWLILRRIYHNLTSPLLDMATGIDSPPSGWREPYDIRLRLNSAQATITDISTRLKQTQTALEYAQNAENSRKQLIADLTHELKTPLAIIYSYAEGLLEGIAEDKREQYLNIILEQSRRMDGLVLQMLDLSRLEAGKVRLSMEPVALLKVTQAVVDRFRLMMEEKDLKLHYVISEDMILTADEGRMEQVISNLMSNAVKYTPESGSIYLRLHQKNGNAHFYIENTAAPLSEEALTKVWESFYRADPSRSEPGTGLGLAVVKNIIQLHRGECTVRNTTLDGGATAVEFGFIVPLS